MVEIVSDNKFILPTRQAHSLFSYLWPILIIVPICGFSYYHLITLDRQQEIMNEFTDEPKQHRFIHGALIILYFVASILLFVLALWLRQIIKNY
ncbi:MAG: hypothetical protein JWP71_818 [Mucilaginibacter sp.]|nr:hypothetical protein [Mucilaginibacter sp.]